MAEASETKICPQCGAFRLGRETKCSNCEFENSGNAIQTPADAFAKVPHAGTEIPKRKKSFGLYPVPLVIAGIAILVFFGFQAANSLGGLSKTEDSTKVIPVVSSSSVKTMLVETLEFYCPNVPSSALEPELWTLVSPLGPPYQLWANSWNGILYLELDKDNKNSNLVRLKANGTLSQTALTKWGCDSPMLIKTGNY